MAANGVMPGSPAENSALAFCGYLRSERTAPKREGPTGRATDRLLCDIECQVGDFVGMLYALLGREPTWQLLCKTLQYFLRRVALIRFAAVEKICRNRSGDKVVDVNPPGPELVGKCLGEQVQSGLGNVVRAVRITRAQPQPG